MNRALSCSCRLAGSCMLLFFVAGTANALPAFPGAEGFGARATGGRGGTVVKVTNLNASGTGSLQWAVDRPGPRIVVFDVSGVINGDLRIPSGNLTIAGQTAPGAGITLHGHLYTDYQTTFGNIVIRHLRVRPPMPDANWPPAQHDAIQMSSNQLLMFDHVDVSHGVDETVDLYDGARDITVQWSMIGFPVQGGGHPDGPDHNYGLLNGPGGGRISIHHTLFAHNNNRTPALSDGPADVVNNVVYNARIGFVHHNPATGHFNIIGNTYKDGASANLVPVFFDPEEITPPLAYFSSGNRVDHPGTFTGILDNPFTTPGFAAAYGGFYCCGVVASMFASPLPFDFSATTGYVPISRQGADAAYGCVLARAGAWPRDVVSRWSAEETAARSGTWGNRRPANWLEGLTPGSPLPDNDGDGMPNAWELAHGLNPNSAADVHTLQPDGYPAIESYINERADALLPGGDRIFRNGFESGTSTDC